MDLTGREIVLGVTGGIAAYKSAQLVSRLRHSGANVHVIMTRNATEFITPLTFQTLSANQVVTDTFQAPEYWNVEHVALAKKLDEDGHLPATFMVLAPGSWQDEVWDDINRMRTLNMNQKLKGRQMHVCPLQLDIVERLINRYSNPGEVVFDPFGGIMTVPYMAVKMGRDGWANELNPDYFRDGLGYLKEADAARDVPTLFDLVEEDAEPKVQQLTIDDIMKDGENEV
jgi:hypothetical protein